MNDLSELIIFSAIENEEAAKNSLDLFLDIAGDSKTKDFSKQKTKTFLNMMYDHLKAKQSSPLSKFYSLYMIKLIIQRSVNKVLSILASHSILKYLHQLAKQTDPNKPMSQKGKSLFIDKQLGNDYIRLILQSLKVLAEKSRSSSQQPTKFKKYYDELKEMKIVLPKELKFFDQAMLGYQRTTKTVSSVNQVTPKSNASINNLKDTPKGGDQKYKQDVQMSLKKVNTFLDVLNTEDDAQSLRKQCEIYHKRFLNETQKYQNLIGKLNFEDDDETHKVLALNDFYLHQAEYYQEYLANQKDYGSYTTKVLMASESLYKDLGTSPPHQQAKMSQNQLAKPQPVPQTTSMRRNNHISDQNEDNKQLVTNLMNKLDQKSRNPNIGFKSIKQSLSKQKSVSRNKRSVSGLKTSKASKFGKSITKSRVSQIFTSPPNPYPKQRRYEGQLITPNTQLDKTMREITKKQGIRRFITCNFKQKSPLFQNTHIQIGVKSQGIYENVNEFKVLIGIELYIGNKSQQLIKNMSINYKGSPDILLYGNPRTVETVLQGGYQHKHQLLIVPLNYQFPLIKMYLKYSVNNQTFYENITLPNSMLKLASHGNITKRDFVAIWNASTTIYRTSEFKFTRYIPPDTLGRYIKPLEELASYEKFIVKGSENDYQLGCQVILKQRYEGVVRINIRPNFNAVIQVAVTQSTEQAIESFIFYAQTLQMLLTHVDHQEL